MISGAPAPGFRKAGGLAALSGLCVVLAFPPFDVVALAFVALVPLLVSLERLAAHARALSWKCWVGSAFATGWVFGTVVFGGLVWWIVMLDAPALTIPWVRYPGTIAIALYLGLYAGFFSTAVVWIRSRTGWPLAVVAPPLFTLAELARASGELGFGWGHLGYSQVEFLPAAQLASITGIHGLSAWIVLANALVASWFSEGGRPRRVATASALVVIVAAPIAWGSWRLAEESSPDTLRVALVQPNIANDVKWKALLRESHFENLAELSREGVAQGAELVVWPETAAPCYLLRDQRWRPFVEDLARELGVPLFTGLPDFVPTTEEQVRYSNTAALFGPDGFAAQRMDKIELVPFGERMPFSQYFTVLERLDFGEADFLPGEHFVVFEAAGTSFANLVCFEAIFPYLTRRYALEGANLLVNITNDSWFGAGSGAEQHAEMAVVRCIESGLGMARCANSGISMGIDAYGRRSGETPLFERRVAVVDVPVDPVPTWFVKWGPWWPRLAGFLAILMGFLAIRGAHPRSETR